jgi:hypothetical protein
MDKMSPAVMLATLLFFGASVFAEESTSATASQSTDLTTGKQQPHGKKYYRHHHKDTKGKAGNRSAATQK